MVRHEIAFPISYHEKSQSTKASPEQCIWQQKRVGSFGVTKGEETTIRFDTDWCMCFPSERFDQWEGRDDSRGTAPTSCIDAWEDIMLFKRGGFLEAKHHNDLQGLLANEIIPCDESMGMMANLHKQKYPNRDRVVSFLRKGKKMKNAGFFFRSDGLTQITFSNGYTVSWGVGAGHYCEGKRKAPALHERVNTLLIEKSWHSEDCEVAVIRGSEFVTRSVYAELFARELNDDVVGYVSPNELARVIEFVSKK